VFYRLDKKVFLACASEPDDLVIYNGIQMFLSLYSKQIWT